MSEYALWTITGIVISIGGILTSDLILLFGGAIAIVYAVWDDIHALLKGERFEL